MAVSTRVIDCDQDLLRSARQVRRAAGDGLLFVVAWAPEEPAHCSFPGLLAALPAHAAVILTGNNGDSFEWESMTIGDLRAAADEYDKRWIVIEPEPRRAIIGVMQQVSDSDILFVLRPPTASARLINLWMGRGEEYRSQLRPWDQ